jgi:predicted DNA-binding transcriptional regulator YafY
MTIAHAIRHHHLLRFTYAGHARVVEPHTYGIDGKGSKTLCGYQVSGGSVSGKPEGWKFFQVDRMQDVTTLAQTFAAPRPEYRRDDQAFALIHAQL